jgi:hypothetical protein
MSVEGHMAKYKYRPPILNIERIRALSLEYAAGRPPAPKEVL